MGLELGVVVRELVVKDGDGHAVEDDAEGDAGKGEDAAQVGLGEHVAVAHCGNTHLEDKRKPEYKDWVGQIHPAGRLVKAAVHSASLSEVSRVSRVITHGDAELVAHCEMLKHAQTHLEQHICVSSILSEQKPLRDAS